MGFSQGACMAAIVAALVRRDGPTSLYPSPQLREDCMLSRRTVSDTRYLAAGEPESESRLALSPSTSKITMCVPELPSGDNDTDPLRSPHLRRRLSTHLDHPLIRRILPLTRPPTRPPRDGSERHAHGPRAERIASSAMPEFACGDA